MRNETRWQKRARIHAACSLTLSCTGLEAYSVWRQIPSDFCGFWNHFSALFSAGRPWCLQIVPLSLPLGMFIKFLQSSLFSSLHCLSLTPLELEVCASTWRCSRCLCQEHGSLSGSICHIHRQWCFKLNTCATKETTEHVGTEQSDPNATFYTDAAAKKSKDAFGSYFPILIWLSTPLTCPRHHLAAADISVIFFFLLTCGFEVPLGVMYRRDRGSWLAFLSLTCRVTPA